jgi:hypothetical protein
MRVPPGAEYLNEYKGEAMTPSATGIFASRPPDRGR